MLVVAEARMTEARPRERDDLWLRRELNYLWSVFFKDVPRANVVEIAYGGFWKTRVGLITLSASGSKTSIRINGYLRFPEVPDFVATATIAHELVHYSHGFGSPLAQRYVHPHRGGIVNRELERRGLGIEQRLSSKWLKENWTDLLARAETDRWLDRLPRSAFTPNEKVSDGLKVANILTTEPIARQ